MSVYSRKVTFTNVVHLSGILLSLPEQLSNLRRRPQRVGAYRFDEKCLLLSTVENEGIQSPGQTDSFLNNFNVWHTISETPTLEYI